MSFTPKQRAFIASYLNDARMNATQAARDAGYAHPESTAADLMRPSHRVRHEINRRLEESLPSEEELLSHLAALATAPEGSEWVKASDKRGAIADLLKLRGRILDRVAVTVDAPTIQDLFGLPSPSEDDSEGDE